MHLSTEETIMTLKKEITIDAPTCWVIVYGNPQLGDDGIGSLVARKLHRYLEHMQDVGICWLPRLDLALLDDIQSADTLIMVVAGKDTPHGDMRWSRITPKLDGCAVGSHHLDSEAFLGLLELLYNKIPSTWMVSIQGYAFDTGETLFSQAHRKAEKAAVQIMNWLFRQNIALTYKKIKKEN
jgi:hydrogenase maturation protease